MNLGRIIIQSDSLTYIDCINSVIDNVVLEPIVANYNLLLSSVQLGSIMFLSRVCNIDSHKLVGLGKLYNSKTWIRGYPSVRLMVYDSTIVS